MLDREMMVDIKYKATPDLARGRWRLTGLMLCRVGPSGGELVIDLSDRQAGSKSKRQIYRKGSRWGGEVKGQLFHLKLSARLPSRLAGTPYCCVTGTVLAALPHSKMPWHPLGVEHTTGCSGRVNERVHVLPMSIDGHLA